ncbi:MAG: hypothetical protein H7X94_00285 [Vallitaleaceae bacterium]|nr:hypothetical protein [Vallitaleaceae bacterium]
MNEKIYTIPVNDAFLEPCECPLCAMYEKLEQDMLYFILENSYMEDDIRKETNEAGFCQKHYNDLMHADNRLGVALMLHTHMQKVQKDLQKLLKSQAPGVKKSLFGKQGQAESPITIFAKNHDTSCYICNRIESTFKIYLDTFFYLWKKDESFIIKVKNSQGFCIQHFAQLYTFAPQKLSTSELSDFFKILLPLQEENFQRVVDDLGWYITKFDYRYKDEPWKNSKDAVIRSIKKISSLKL